MAERMADELTAAGARVRLDREFPSSPSVIAELGAAEGEGPTIQWHGHLDAIDVEHTRARAARRRPASAAARPT